MRRKLSFRLAGFVLLLAFGHCCVQVAAMPPGDGDDSPNIQAVLCAVQWWQAKVRETVERVIGGLTGEQLHGVADVLDDLDDEMDEVVSWAWIWLKPLVATV